MVTEVAPGLLSLKLLSKEMLTKDILLLRFEKPAGFVFRPGQFVQFAVPFEGKNLMRSYSITSTPDKDYLEFCTKLIPGGKASDMFAVAEVGQKYKVAPPKGVFVCDTTNKNPVIFIATGTGIAPIMAMAPAVLKNGNTPVSLVFGLRTEQDIFWNGEFNKLAQEFSSFKYLLTLSQPSSTWQGKKGRVTEYVSELIQNEAKYYICGSVEMVKDTRQILVASGVYAGNIHFEIY